MGQLQTILSTFFGDQTAEDYEGPIYSVYLQPPDKRLMEYPCILISRDVGDTKFADNSPYRHTRRYQLTIIDRDPETFLYDPVAALPMCVHNRAYKADGLNHDVFIMYFEEESA